MAFCCEVDYVIYIVGFEYVVYTFFVADVTFDEKVILSVGNFFEVIITLRLFSGFMLSS